MQDLPLVITGSDVYEMAPSLKDNTHIWNKWTPINKTLAVAGTAENLWSAPASSQVAAVNLVTNPSFETGSPPTGFTASGSTLAQSGSNARTGSNCIEVTPDNAAAGEGFYWTSPSVGGTGDKGLYLVASVYLRRASGSGSDAKINISNSSGTSVLDGNVVTLSTTYTRSVVRYVLPGDGNATYRIYVKTDTQHGTAFLADDLQVELRKDGMATDFVNPITPGDVNTKWLGTANASMSQRRAPLKRVRGFSLYCSQDVYISFGLTASSTTGLYIPATTWVTSQWPFEEDANVSFINATGGQTPQVRGILWGTH